MINIDQYEYTKSLLSKLIKIYEYLTNIYFEAHDLNTGEINFNIEILIDDTNNAIEAAREVLNNANAEEFKK